MDQPRANLVAGNRKVARAKGIHLICCITVGFAAVHIGESRAVDNGIGLVAADIGDGGLAVGDIEVVNIHRQNRSLAQPFGQRAKHAAFVGQLALQLGAELPAAAGNQDLHALPP